MGLASLVLVFASASRGHKRVVFHRAKPFWMRFEQAVYISDRIPITNTRVLRTPSVVSWTLACLSGEQCV